MVWDFTSCGGLPRVVCRGPVGVVDGLVGGVEEEGFVCAEAAALWELEIAECSVWLLSRFLRWVIAFPIDL